MRPTSFKIIAVKPLADCDPDLRKVLQKDELYYLYRNCEITPQEELLVAGQFLSEEFFSKGNTKIELNAVVGKNGSGKSSLVELFLMAFNNLAYSYARFRPSLSLVKRLHVQVYFTLGDRFYKLEVRDELTKIFRYNKIKKQMTEYPKLSLKALFYSIVVNYSHYSYNELAYPKDQNWLPGLFHKNDGYQIPIVLNPLRIKGVIDINNENILINARVMANVLRKGDEEFSFRQLTDKFIADHLRLSKRVIRSTDILYNYNDPATKDTIEVRFNSINFDRGMILKLISKKWEIDLPSFQKPRNESAVKYILLKLVTICLKYEVYRDYFDREKKCFKPNMLIEFLDAILDDNSHVSWKLKQTLNYVKFEHIEPNARKLDLDSFGQKVLLILEKKSNRVGELIELLPPPIFHSQVILKDIKTGDLVEFQHLSSGEKQWIYSVSSFLYHLNNLDSIPLKDKSRNAYERVFIVLEEIELYFHPEMQRKYIKHIISSIERMALRNIKHVQVLLITHSPFILSDIPEQNILFLKDEGVPEEKQNLNKTFGGNIHELLAKNFFLEESLIGAFSRAKIEHVIKRVRSDSPEILFKERAELLEVILLIGEDFLKDKLLEMFEAKAGVVDKQIRIRMLQEEIKRLSDD